MVTNWQHRIQGIGPLISKMPEAPTSGDLQALAGKIHHRLTEERENILRRQPSALPPLEVVADEFHTLAVSDDPEVSQDEIDDLLGQMYDWADEYYIWIDPVQ